MTTAINELVRSVLQKDSLQNCNLQELQQLADQYPFFAAPQLLLARKLKEENSQAFPAQLQKTSLFFPDPLWMGQLLAEKGNAVIDQKQNDTREEIINETVSTEPDHSTATGEMEQAVHIMEEAGASIPTLPAVISVAGEPSGIVTETPEEIQLPAPVEEVFTDNEYGHEIIVPGNEQMIQEEQSQPEMMTAEESEEDDLEINEGPGPAMNIPSLKIEPIDMATAELSFQPYHTVDYFASQGIKFRDEEKPKDKFGQQLKSFTEWLKILKKAPVTEMMTTIHIPSEQKVEQLAQHSVSDREVLTEAMAEVWEKQGNPEKAIAIYRKLSLLNPSKSSYFASLIEQLKNS